MSFQVNNKYFSTTEQTRRKRVKESREEDTKLLHEFVRYSKGCYPNDWWGWQFIHDGIIYYIKENTRHSLTYWRFEINKFTISKTCLGKTIIRREECPVFVEFMKKKKAWADFQEGAE